MGHLNVEIKARCDDLGKIRKYLRDNNADFKGTDHQIDTYFKVPNGRLKLREGTIENYLVHYERENTSGPKQAKVTLFKSEPGTSLKELLTKALGILVTVDKKREIAFIGNVKFHMDTVEGLGTFMEIEARDTEGVLTGELLLTQCQKYLDALGISKDDYIDVSYSDLLMAGP